MDVTFCQNFLESYIQCTAYSFLSFVENVQCNVCLSLSIAIHSEMFIISSNYIFVHRLFTVEARHTVLHFSFETDNRHTVEGSFVPNTTTMTGKMPI